MDRATAGYWVQAEQSRRTLIDAAAALRGRCQLLAFKGVHLVHMANMPYRPCLDADAVVVGDSLQEAARLLCKAGWSEGRLSTLGTRYLVHPISSAPLDLHSTPLPPGFGRMNREVLHSRARLGEGPLEGVLVPDPLDAACLAIAHYAKDGFGTTHGHGLVDRDLDVLLSRFYLRPDTLFPRLIEHGLRRIALLAFENLTREQRRWAPWRDAAIASAIEHDIASRIVDWAALGRPSARYIWPFVVRAFADRSIDGLRGVGVCAATFAHDWSQHFQMRVVGKVAGRARPNT